MLNPVGKFIDYSAGTCRIDKQVIMALALENVVKGRTGVSKSMIQNIPKVGDFNQALMFWLEAISCLLPKNVKLENYFYYLRVILIHNSYQIKDGVSGIPLDIYNVVTLKRF